MVSLECGLGRLRSMCTQGKCHQLQQSYILTELHVVKNVNNNVYISAQMTLNTAHVRGKGGY